MYTGGINTEQQTCSDSASSGPGFHAQVSQETRVHIEKSVI